MIRPGIIGIMSAAAAACTSNAPARPDLLQPDLLQIVRAEIATVVAADRAVSCIRSRDDALDGYDCIQAFTPADTRQFAVLSVKVRRAEGPGPVGASRLVSTSFGPGGGGSTYKGRTRDGVYDVLATEMQNVIDDQQLRLPAAAGLIDKVIAAYDRAG